MNQLKSILALFAALLFASAVGAQTASIAIPDSVLPLADTMATVTIDLEFTTVSFSVVYTDEDEDEGTTITLPADPADLDDDWVDQNDQGPNRTTFKHKDTGIIISFDKGQPGETGWKGKDHWHVQNPNWKPQDKKKNKYIDKDGNPCHENSNPSHLEPPITVTVPKKKAAGTSVIDPSSVSTESTIE